MTKIYGSATQVGLTHKQPEMQGCAFLTVATNASVKAQGHQYP